MEWYIEQEGKQHGPLAFEQIKELLKTGKARHDTLVWRQGSEKWVRIDETQDFSELCDNLFPKEIKPPPLPRVCKVPASYAWRRFVAKFLDLALAIAAALLLLLVLSPENYSTFFLLSICLSATIWLVLEVASECKTLGRLILGVTVKRTDDNASYFERAILLSLVGMGLEIPIVSAITKTLAYFSYRKTGTTYWDRNKFQVDFKPCGFQRWAIAVGVLVTFAAAHSFLGKLNGERMSVPSGEFYQSTEQKLPPSSAKDIAVISVPKVQTLALSRWDPAKHLAISAGEIQVPIYPDVTVDATEPVLHGPRNSFAIYYRTFHLPATIGNRKFKTVEDWVDANFDVDFRAKRSQSVMVLKRKPDVDIASYERVSQREGYELETRYYFGKGSQMYLVTIYYSMSSPVGHRLACNQLNALLQSLSAPSLNGWPAVGLTEYCTKGA